MTLKDIQIHGWLQDVNDNFAALGGGALARGIHTATSDEATAGEVEILTGLENPSLYFIQIYRAGVNVRGNVVITHEENGTLVVEDGAGGGAYEVTAGDKIHWLAFDMPVEESE
jgi:hypothetical protein